MYVYSFFNLGARWRRVVNARSGRFNPGKDTRYPLYRRLGGPQSWSGRLLKISFPEGFDPRTLQHIASDYTPWQMLLYSQTKDNEIGGSCGMQGIGGESKQKNRRGRERRKWEDNIKTGVK